MGLFDSYGALLRRNLSESLVPEKQQTFISPFLSGGQGPDLQPVQAFTQADIPKRPGLFARFAATDPETGANGWDRLMMAGAALRSADDGGASLANLMEMRQRQQLFKQKQALQQSEMQAREQLARAIAPQPGAPGIAPIGDFQGTAPTQGRGMATLRQAAPALAQAAAQGIDISDYVTLLDKAGPSIKYEGGIRYDERDPNSAPDFIPTLDKGQEPLFDRSGRIVGVRNMDGSVQAAADMAGAVARAQEGAKAGQDVISVKMPDGSEQQVPRDLAAAITRAQMLGGVEGGGLPAGFGRSQSPAEQAAAVDLAKGGVERELAQPQQWAGLQDQARATDLAIQTINEILGQTQGPDGKFVQSGDSMVSNLSTGFGANLAGIKGTPAFNLDAKIATLKGIIGLGELQKMRANSPTGGVLGNVSERENTILQSLYGALQTGQDPKQFVQELVKARDQLLEVKRQREALYRQTYGGQRGPSQPRTPTMTGPRGSRIISVQ